MKKQNILLILSLLLGNTMTAQITSDENDSAYMSVQFDVLTIKGTPSSSRMILSSLPVSAVSMAELKDISGGNIISSLCVQPGVTEITTGSGISKPVIRGLGYNRIAVVNDGIRQEGNQWGDEHGIEIDENTVDSVEIIKGPSSLMYGSDAMAGVVIMHDVPTAGEKPFTGRFASEYQSNNGLIGGSLRLGYNKNDVFVNGKFSAKTAHDYQNKIDGFVPGSGFTELDGKLKAGIEKKWGHTYVTASMFNLMPEIIEGERDSISGELESESENLKSYAVALPFQKVRNYKKCTVSSVWNDEDDFRVSAKQPSGIRGGKR